MGPFIAGRHRVADGPRGSANEAAERPPTADEQRRPENEVKPAVEQQEVGTRDR